MSAWTWCRSRPWTWAVAAGVSGGIAGYTAGYYTLPTREEWRSVVSIQEKIVEVEKEVVRVVETRGPVRTVTKVVERVVPGECGGPPLVLRDTETVEEEGPVLLTTDTVYDERRELEALGVTATSHEVVRDPPRFTLFATVGAGFSAGTLTPPAIGAGIAYRFLGPMVLVGQAEMETNLLSGSARLGLGVQF